MKIALLTDGIYPFVTGGIQKHTYKMAKYLANRKIFVDIYSSFSNESDIISLRKLFSWEENEFIDIIGIPIAKRLYFPGHYVVESYNYSSNIFRSIKIKKVQYDIIYCQGFTALKKLFESDVIKEKLIVNMHGLNMFQTSMSIKNRLENYILQIPARIILRKTKYHISLGGKLNYILEKYTKNKSVIWEIPNAVDLNWVKWGKEGSQNKLRRFVFIGRYDKTKGLELINSVIKKIDNSLRFHLDIIGPIPDKLKLNDKRVTYHGIVIEESLIKNTLDMSDCLLCPSMSEGMPTVILEAMACKCAIIATDVGAINCLVSEENGWLIQPNDMHGLELALINAVKLSDEELKVKQTNSLKTIKDRYTWDIVTSLFIKEVEKILVK